MEYSYSHADNASDGPKNALPNRSMDAVSEINSDRIGKISLDIIPRKRLQGIYFQ